MTMREKGASKDEEETQSLSIIVVKIGRNWYVANMDYIQKQIMVMV